MHKLKQVCLIMLMIRTTRLLYTCNAVLLVYKIVSVTSVLLYFDKEIILSGNEIIELIDKQLFELHCDIHLVIRHTKGTLLKRSPKDFSFKCTFSNSIIEQRFNEGSHSQCSGTNKDHGP